MRTLWLDVRYAIRLLCKSWGFAAVAIVTLALGIGANTAVFSLIDQAVLEPLPVKDPQGLAQVVLETPAGAEFSNMDYPEFRPLVEDRRSFSGMLLYSEQSSDLQWAGHSERARELVVSGSFYGVLGINVLLGRTITGHDDSQSSPPVAVLSYGFWKRRFGGGTSALGQTIYLDGKAFTVVGVTPPSFFGLDRLWTPDVTVPFSSVPTPSSVYCVGRLRPGVTRAQALAELNVSLQRSLAGMSGEIEKWPAEEREQELGLKARLIPAGIGDWGMSLTLASILPVLAMCVGILLLVACANLASLMLVRGSARSAELKIRMALGAGRRRVVRQLLTEAALLSAAGGLLGLLVALATHPFLVRLLPIAPDAAVSFPLDFRLFGFAAAVSLVAALLSAAFPALRATRESAHSSFANAAVGEARKAGRRPARALLSIQLAACVALLGGAGLLVRTLYNLGAVNPGFDSRHLLLLDIDTRLAQADGAAEVQMNQELLRQVRALPGVRSAALSLNALFGSGGWQKDVWVRGYDYRKGENQFVANNVVSPDFFATAGIPFLLGRDFRPADRVIAGHIAIVNEAFARKYFLGRDPIGGRFGDEGAGSEDQYEIIGVVRDAKYGSLRDKALPTIFQVLTEPYANGRLVLHVRTEASPAAAARVVAQAVRSVNRELVVYDTRTMSQQISDSLSQEQSLATGAAILAILALGLACIGVYGVAAYSVSRRTREIGIRMALGAQPAEIGRLILREGLWLWLAGLAIGLAFAWPLSRLLRGLLFGVTPGDPLTFAAVAILLASVALGASWIPARRAARVEPNVALRHE